MTKYAQNLRKVVKAAGEQLMTGHQFTTLANVANARKQAEL